MITFARTETGLGIWRDGQFVGTIPLDRLPGLIYEAAALLRG